MIKWLKNQLNYRDKYLAALETTKEASQNALMILGKYEALTASLPLDHELSTQRHWKEYADRVFMRENGNLRNSLEHLREVHDRMVNEWQDGIFRYGVQMYGKWQPMELIPHDQFVLVFASYEGKTKTFVGKLDFHSEGSDAWVFLADDKWEYPRDEDGKSIPIKETKIVCYATHWMPLPEMPK